MSKPETISDQAESSPAIESEQPLQQETEGVTSSSTQIGINGEEKDVEESVNGCDSTTEVNETLLDGDISQDSETTESNIEIKTELTQDSEENSLSTKSDENLLLKTSECSDECENATPKTSRELKSILALSKEAKLDTNISTNRRKTLDIIKSKTSSPKNSMKITNFPVTAESELDSLTEKSEKKTATGKKRKNSLTESGAEGAGNEESRRSLQGFSGDFVMLKKPNKDIFCWRCHHDSVQIACETCPRAYHLKCLKQTIVDMEHWPCPECVSILKAENTKTRSKAMKDMTLEHLCNLLKFAVKRMIQCSGSEPFVHPVDEKQFPEYRSYIIQPMTLTMLEKNIKENLYGSTTAFESDAKWIVHNSIIFNSYQSKLTTAAKTIVKICKQEMAEIENCASCYLNANTKKHTWFVEVCPKPHLLVWAKLKGFPYWPAKVMSISASALADVRFFGAHDKAWVSCKDCFLYSIKDPNSGKQKRNDIIECVRELELYVDNLKKSYGKVVFAPFKTHLDPENQLSQLQMFLPLFKNENSKRQDVECNSSEEKIETEKEEIKTVEKNDNGSVESEQNCDIKKKADIIVKKTQEVTMTRIDYTNVSGGKPKLTARPIKAILIRKRHSTDNAENKLKFPRREISSGRTSLDLNIKNENTKEKLVEKPAPNSKLKITEQLIKKLQRDEAEEKSMLSMEVDQKEEDSEANKTESVSIKPVLEKTEEKEEPVKTEKEKPKPTESKTVEKSIGSVTVDSDDGSQDGKDISIGEIDPANICNIIHSSLVTPIKKTTLEKKRKLSDDEDQSKSDEKGDSNNLFPPNKMVKLVPIENILKKKNEIVVLKELGIVENKTEISNNNNSNNKTETNETTSSSTSKEPAVKIKSELESEGEEENNDLQYMEAKRKYLSALNISEKQKVPIKPKAHEIRTRSKTEEKKSKSDNISRIIDDVASRSAETTPTSKSNENVKEIYIKSISKMQAPKHKARKSFPSPNYTKKTVVARKIVPKGAAENDIRLVDGTTLQPITPPGNVMILPKLHYSKNPPPLRDLSCPPVLTLLPRGPPEPAVEGSQNYIPQNENDLRRKNASETSSNSSVSAPSVIDIESPLNLDTELGALKDILPESVTKSVSEILCQAPPKLKPKPSLLLSTVVDSGVPSTAGPVSSRVNSMAQKLGDYFRGMLVESINDIGKSNNPEATISSLKMTIEELNHKHAIELAEIRRNVSIVLKDIQKIVVEERERVVNETKASCEIETNRRVEEAKSKQWCTWCSKEAQFYCCWNTSYCDYPCQQKHWLKHMSKCTQTANPNQSSSSTRPSGQPLVLTPTTAPKFATLFAKPQKVYLKRTNNQFKQSAASTTGTGGGSGHITLVEAGPGNFELLGNGSISVNGKILASTSVLEKIKSGNIVTVTAPSSSTNTQLTSSGGTQKVKTVAKSTASSSDSEH